MARLILPTVEQWIVLEALGLTTTADTTSIVLVAPWVSHDLTQEGGDLTDTLGLRYIKIEYENGGESDIQLDIIKGHDHYGINQLRKHANLPVMEEEEDDGEWENAEWEEFDRDWDDEDDDDTGDEWDRASSYNPIEEGRWDDGDEERVSFID